MTTPPKLAERWLMRRLAVDERDELIGDINEQFHKRVDEHGDAKARRWYWRQTFALLWGFSLRRRDVVSTAHERTRGKWALDLLITDLRYAWRSLMHARSFALTAWLTITFGIGISTAVFSLVRGVLLDPLPYAHADRLVRISERRPDGLMNNDAGVVSDVGMGAWASVRTALSVISPYGTFDGTVTLPTMADNMHVADVGRDFFSVISAQPIAGRVLVPSDIEPGAPLAAVISARVAARAFSSPQESLGQLVTIDTQNYQIVGVLSERFAFPDAGTDVWRPGRQYRRLPTPGDQRNMSFRSELIGLLREGATIADAQANAAAVAATLSAASEDAGAAPITTSFTVRRLLDQMVAPIRTALLILTWGTVVALAAACASLAALLLSRTTARQREVAVRLALGANRWRVGRPVLFELATLSIAGGLGASLLAWWLLRALPALAPADLPRVESIQFDVRALILALAASAVVVMISGFLPVWRLASVNLREISSASNRVRTGSGTGSGDTARGFLAGAQIALAVILIVAALLTGRSLMALLSVSLGYDPSRVIAFQSAQTLAAGREKGRLSNYYRALIERLAAGPGVVSVGQASVLPMHAITSMSNLRIVGRPVEPLKSEDDMAINQYISPDYLKTMGIRMVSGRGITAADTMESEHVTLIDELLAKRYFPAGDAIGHQLQHGVWGGTIVGVVAAVHHGAPGDAPKPVVYWPAAQSSEYLAYMNTGVAIRTSGDPRALGAFIRQAAKDVDPRVPIYNLRSLSEDLGMTVAGPRFFAIVLGLFAALALSTALLGIYGVLAYAVERRRLEFGIRRALGATEQDVTTLVMMRAAVFASAGLIGGLTLAAIGARFSRTLLFGVTAFDPWSFAGAIVLVLLIVLGASWQPVRRAIRIDPARALRVD